MKVRCLLLLVVVAVLTGCAGLDVDRDDENHDPKSFAITPAGLQDPWIESKEQPGELLSTWAAEAQKKLRDLVLSAVVRPVLVYSIPYWRETIVFQMGLHSKQGTKTGIRRARIGIIGSDFICSWRVRERKGNDTTSWTLSRSANTFAADLEVDGPTNLPGESRVLIEVHVYVIRPGSSTAREALNLYNSGFSDGEPSNGWPEGLKCGDQPDTVVGRMKSQIVNPFQYAVPAPFTRALVLECVSNGVRQGEAYVIGQSTESCADAGRIAQRNAIETNRCENQADRIYPGWTVGKRKWLHTNTCSN